jgi:hypothetical protein
METCRRLANPVDVSRSHGFIVLAITSAMACAGTRSPATTAPTRIPETAATPAVTPPDPPRAPDPDLNRPPPRKRLDIDWAQVALTDDAAAIALWQRIAPTGADWQDKLQEIPPEAQRPLAIAVLHGGNFLCTRQPAGDCAPPVYDVEQPADTAGFTDPCLRRLLALWSFERLSDDDLPAIHDALLAIAALPPPESELVASAIYAAPEDDQDARLALVAAAWRAGQREVVGRAIGKLDEPHLFAAVRRHHIDSALEVLSAEAHRAVYLAAIGDEALGTRARTRAIDDLAAQGDKLPPDLASALVAAVTAKDCGVAAAAARALDQHGDHRFVPRRPRTTSTARLMRAACVLASYEALLRNDEASLVPGYMPARGLERVTISYDPLSDDDSDGDGDPHTTHATQLVPRDEAVLPELEDLVRAMQHCTGTICVSEDREFRFVWRPLGGEVVLARLELAERVPCPPSKAP